VPRNGGMEKARGGHDIRRNFPNTFEAVYVDKNAVARRLFEIKKNNKTDRTRPKRSCSWPTAQDNLTLFPATSTLVKSNTMLV